MENLPWKELKIKAERLLNDFRVNEGCEILQRAPYHAVDEERERQLLLAKTYILRGLLSLAQETLNEFSRLGGDQERLLLEQLNLYYLSGSFAKWNTAISRSLTQFKIENQFRFFYLSANDQIGILKHFEEAGFISEVIESYEFLRKQNLEDWEILKIDTQLIRLYSLWKIKGPLPDIYQKLLLLSKSELNQDIFTEVQHGLMLAEMVLFGKEAGIERLKNILALTLDMFDRKLITFDFIELFVHLEKKLPTLDLPLDRLGSLDPYESHIMGIMHSSDIDLVINMSEITSSAFFRLVAFANSLDRRISKVNSQRCVFLIGQFASKTKKLWTARMSLSLQTEESSEVSISDGLLSCNGMTLSLENQPILSLIADLIGKSKEKLSLEDLAFKVFGQELDLSIQDRLRVHINRLNRLFESQLGVVKPLKISGGFLVSSLVFHRPG